jgi:coenzyme F420 hydrogenase subunit beta
MGALDYRKLRDYLKTIGIDGPIQKYDIPPPPAQIFQIQTEQGCQEFPIDEIRPSIQEGCGLCQDMTAELSGHSGRNGRVEYRGGPKRKRFSTAERVY